MPFVPPFTQIAPRSIHRNNQLNFLTPKPAFDAFLALNRVAHIVKTLVVNQPIDPVAFAKYRSVSKLVFPDTPPKIICNSNVKCLGAVCQDINIVVTVAAGMHSPFAVNREVVTILL
jgi:hypothetical protein